MGGRASRRRVGSASTVSNTTFSEKVFPQDPSAPATMEDKRNWKGFCEIESEPVRFHHIYSILSVDMCLQQLQAFFNIMLKKFGVQGVKVQEIVSLDNEILAFLP